MSFLHTDITQVVKILPQVRQELTYSTKSVSWVLMSAWCMESGHQQPWYLLCETGLIRFSHVKGLSYTLFIHIANIIYQYHQSNVTETIREKFLWGNLCSFCVLLKQKGRQCSCFIIAVGVDDTISKDKAETFNYFPPETLTCKKLSLTRTFWRNISNRCAGVVLPWSCMADNVP